MAKLSTMNRLRREAECLWRDTRGVILPYVTIMLVVIIGVALLALDGARLMSLQTQLQNGADAFALAGAAELDRLPDAETRATNAINRLLTNSTLFGTGTNKNVQVSSIEFYSELPASDVSPISTGTLATSSLDARFVAVTVRPLSLNTVLPAALFGGSSVVATGASAVAGFDQVVCQVTPIYVCNPYEAQGMSYEHATAALQEAAANPAYQRRLMLLRQYSGVGPRVPGDYGFLLSPTIGPDAPSSINAVAVVHPAACFLQKGVNFRPGLLTAMPDAVNVRFDIYQGSMSGKESNSDYRPALNVRKGFIGGGASAGGNSCNARPANSWPMGRPPNQATGLPLDQVWPYLDGRMGNGNWDFDTYWQVNHSANDRPVPIFNSARASNSNLPSRYFIYRYEIEHGYVTDISPGGETGAPTCYSGGTLLDAPDRRTIQAAIVNCQSQGLSGEGPTDVPVAAFGKFFVTLPMATSQTDMFVELTGLLRPGDYGNFDLVQLYR